MNDDGWHSIPKRGGRKTRGTGKKFDRDLLSAELPELKMRIIERSGDTWVYGDQVVYSGKVSTCRFPGLQATLSGVPRDAWIICPVYHTEEGWDCQIGVTGKRVRVDGRIETHSQAIWREIAEEIGVRVDFTQIQPIGEYPQGKVTWNAYRIHANSVVAINEHEAETFPSYSRENEVPTKRVGGVIYGSQDVIGSMIENLEVLGGRNSDRIVGVTAMPATLALRAVGRMYAQRFRYNQAVSFEQLGL